MSFQESERKRKSERNTSIAKFGNTDILVFQVNPFSQVDQAEGFDGEEQYRYHEEIDTHDDDDYNGLSMDEIVELFEAKIDKRFEEHTAQVKITNDNASKNAFIFSIIYETD